MTAVIVYRFQAWDQSAGEYKLSRRMATRKGIEMCKGKTLEDTAIEIDSSQLERGEGGPPSLPNSTYCVFAVSARLFHVLCRITSIM